jgi:hypothetical protein
MFIGIGLGINAIRADVAAAVLTPVNTGAPTFSPTTGKIGTSHTASGDTWDAYDEREYRVQVGGVTVSSSATYTPVGGDDGESMVGQVRARNTGGAWSAWASTAPLTVTYPVAVAAGALADQSYTQGTGDQTVNAATDFTGATGGTWSVSGGGASIDGSGVVTIPTDTLLAGVTVTVTYTNSGGVASSAFQVTVAAGAAVPAAFTTGMWTVEDRATTGELRVAINDLPSDGGSPITTIEYRVNSGSWVDTGSALGVTFIIGGLTNAASASVELRAVNANGDGAVGTARTGTPTLGSRISTTSVSSFTYAGVTVNLSKAMSVGYYHDGHPFVIREASTSITSSSPAAQQITTGAWTDLRDGAVSGASYWVNGAMFDPYLIPRPEIPGNTKQGFSRFLQASTSAIGLSKTTTFDGSLCVDPGYTGAAVPIPATDTTWVKSVHKTGQTTPDTQTFDKFIAVHFVSEAPFVGAFAPAPCDLDKTPIAYAQDRNKACLGTGFTPSTYMPSLSTVTTNEYIRSDLYPLWGQSGEVNRRYMTGPDDYAGTSAGYGVHWSEYIAALQAEGASAVSDADFDRAVSLALAFHGVRRRMIHEGDITSSDFTKPGGAGQAAGYGLLGFFLGFAIPPLYPQAILAGGNAFGAQTFWVEASHVGVATRWPGNHYVYNQTYLPEQIGLPEWTVETYAFFADSQIAADYRTTSGPATFPETLVAMLLKAGPGGIDGSQAIARSGAYDLTNPFAASMAYMDRQRTWTDVHGSVDPVRYTHRPFYDDRRDDCHMPRWHGQPDQFMPRNANLSTYLTAGSGSFSWNLSTAAHATETILEYRVQYSLDGVQFVDVDTQGVSGTQTGLIASQLYYVRWKRRSASGWSPWSMNFKQFSTDSAGRMLVTTTGTKSGTVTNTVAPMLMSKVYPLWKGSYFEEAPDALDLGTPIYIGRGMWTGNVTGGPTYADLTSATEGGTYTAGAGAIAAGAYASFYDPVAADADLWLKADVTQNGVTARSGAVQLGHLPAIPADTIVDTAFGYNFKLLYPDIWTSLGAESFNVSQVVHLPDYTLYSTPVDDDDPVTLIASGIVLGEKSAKNAALIAEIGTVRPLTIGQTYEVTATVPTDVPMSGGAARPWAGPLKWRLGTTKNGVDYQPLTTETVDTHPMQITLTATFVATTTTLWFEAYASTSTGGTAGGNPALNSLKVVKL